MLQPVTDSDLAFILKWRNHSEVRNVMFTDREIPMAEHMSWWEKTKVDPGRRVYLFLFRDQPVGVVNYFDIEPGQRRCHWGFYLDNGRDWASGERLDAWLALEQEVIDHAFGPLQCDTLVCETFAFNEHVLALHRKFGFKETRTFNRDKDGQAQPVVEMELDRATGRQPDPERVLREKGRAMPVAFLGSANWDLVAQDFEREYEAVTGEQAAAVPVPFGQYRTLLADADSTLRVANPDYCFFCERFEDLLEGPFSIFDASGRETVERKFADYLELIGAARKRMTSCFLVMDLAPVRPVAATLDSAPYEDDSEAGFVTSLNRRLAEFCGSLPDCHVVRLSSLVDTLGARQANPGKYWHLGRIPFQAAFVQVLNRRLIQTILALSGKTARVLVLDLDNTLWGGVIGDDGMSGIRLGGDYPGSVFVEVQETIKAFRNRGVALAICSKNTEAVALEAIGTHPGMRLRPDDFVVTKINWKDKADNIREIALEIGVGLSSICVVDDSPYERDAIRRMVPGVIVPEMPLDLTQWPAFLLDHPWLAGLRLTAEDRERVGRYKVRARIQKEEAGFGNKEDYWRSLGMHLCFHRFGEANQQRVLQLLSKTNQFNMTTRRYGEADLSRIRQEGGVIVPVGMSDKYSSPEIIGVLVLLHSGEQALTVDSFLLSCRVLGRSVESGIVGWICNYAKDRRYRLLEGLFSATERNQPASGVYRDHGFADTGTGKWLLNIERASVALPEWFAVTDELDQ